MDPTVGKVAETGMQRNRLRIKSGRSLVFPADLRRYDEQRCSEIRPDLEVEQTLECGSALRQQPSESLQEPAGK